MVLAFLVSCSGSSQPPRILGDFTEDFPGLETTLSIEPQKLEAGSAARLELTLANTTAADMHLRFPDQRQLGLLVYDRGDLVYVDERSVTIPVSLELGTLQSWSYTLDWDGRVEQNGREFDLDPGTYEIQIALRRTSDVFVNRSNRVTIEILDKALP